MNKINLLAMLLGCCLTSNVIAQDSIASFDQTFNANAIKSNENYNNPPWKNKVRFYTKQFENRDLDFTNFRSKQGHGESLSINVVTSQIGYISVSMETQITITQIRNDIHPYSFSSIHVDGDLFDMGSSNDKQKTIYTNPGLSITTPYLRGADFSLGLDNAHKSNLPAISPQYKSPELPSYSEIMLYELDQNGSEHLVSTKTQTLENSIGAGGDVTAPVTIWLNVANEWLRADRSTGDLDSGRSKLYPMDYPATKADKIFMGDGLKAYHHYRIQIEVVLRGFREAISVTDNRMIVVTA